MTKLTFLSVFVLAAVLLTVPTHAQEVPITSLTQPEQVCERGFTNVVGIKELRDGRGI